jgi:hypothetical protein
MTVEPISELSLTERILIPGVLLLGLVVTIGLTTFLGFGVIALIERTL